jgi:putative endonuclease
MELRFYVYIMTNKPGGTLYVGVTNNLPIRTTQHKQGLAGGFTKRYKLDKLVYYEVFDDIHDAIKREKQLKRWRRAWKIRLIKTVNSKWQDLFDDFNFG